MKILPQPHPNRMSLAMLAGHLKFCHGTWVTGSESIESLRECHKIRHVDPDPPYDVEHEHESSGRPR